MTLALRTLLDRIIDYAGIFPPAQLPLEEAVRRYADALRSPHAWIVGRFICPVARLAELAEIREHLDPRTLQDSRAAQDPQSVRTWSISALGRSGADSAAFLDGLDADLRTARGLRESSAGAAPRSTLDAYETRLPNDVALSNARDATRALVADASQRIAAHGPANTAVSSFFELSMAGDWRAGAEAVIAGIADHNAALPDAPLRQVGSSPQPAGVKLRTGGVEAAAFPSAEQVAFVVARCAAHSVAWKATAGLHHPIRHFNDGVRCRMHGFLNLFAGAALLFDNHSSAVRDETVAPPFRENDLRSMLEDESPAAFEFDDRGLTWRGRQLSIDAIRTARQRFAISFGSCSIDEPLEDLARLGLM